MHAEAELYKILRRCLTPALGDIAFSPDVTRASGVTTTVNVLSHTAACEMSHEAVRGQDRAHAITGEWTARRQHKSKKSMSHRLHG